MNIKTTCPYCLRKLDVRLDLAGKTVRCPGCKKRITIRGVKNPLPSRNSHSPENPSEVDEVPESEDQESLDWVDLVEIPDEQDIHDLPVQSDQIDQRKKPVASDNMALNDDDFEQAPRPLKRKATSESTDVVVQKSSSTVSRANLLQNPWLLRSLAGLAGVAIGFPIGYFLRGRM